jgi:hypothetical protein
MIRWQVGSAVRRERLHVSIEEQLESIVFVDIAAEATVEDLPDDVG